MIVVGIDIGTSSAKICGKKIGEEKILFDAHENYSTSCTSTQDPLKILEVVVNLLEKYTKDLEVSEIWTCGQMHGIVCWKSSTIFVGSQISDLKCSMLYNWMYDCPQEFLKSLPDWENAQIYPGFGLVTMAYLKNSQSQEFFEDFDKCGTIMELFLSYLTKSRHVKISHHNAYSWGYCSLEPPLQWQKDILNFLPKNVELPQIVVGGMEEVYGVWNGARCYVASGDLQASVASLGRVEDGTAYLIIGTSAQLCLLHPSTNPLPTILPPTVVNLPYSSTHRLLATCAMNGGNAIQKIFEEYCTKHSHGESLRETLTLLNEKPKPSNLRVDPIFLPERGSSARLQIPELNGFDELEIIEAAHLGIIKNIFSMFPIDMVSKLALVGAAREPRFSRQIRLVAPDLRLVEMSEMGVSTQFGATKLA